MYTFEELVKAQQVERAKQSVKNLEVAIANIEALPLSEITEEQAQAMHASDPLFAPPFMAKAIEPEEEQEEEQEEEVDENQQELDLVFKSEPEADPDDDDTLDAVYNPHIVIPSNLRTHVKKALQYKRQTGQGSSEAKKLGLALQRKHYEKVDLNHVEQMLDGLGSDDPDEQVNAMLAGGHIMLDVLSKAQPSVPEKYLTGLSGEERAKRKKEIQARIKGKDSYKPLTGDEDAETKPSKYTKTKLASAVREEVKSQGKDEFLRASAKIGKAPKAILEKVYDRGLKAWATSGHRAGASAQAWAKARVYSFLTNGKTTRTGDKDLYKEWKSK